MERSRNMHTLSEILLPSRDQRAVASAAWHGLFWLAFANAVGVLIAILLLVPALNRQLGEWTYGRWMMVHMNLELYGWASIPLVGFFANGEIVKAGQIWQAIVLAVPMTEHVPTVGAKRLLTVSIS